MTGQGAIRPESEDDRDGDVPEGPDASATLADRAYAALEEMIVDRRLAPGQMISEAEIGAALGLGRTPVREAIARLKMIGFVEVHRRRGVQVSTIDPIKHLELLEVRLPLEKEVARHNVDRASEADLAELATVTAVLLTAAETGDRTAYFRAKRQLHACEVKAARNTVLTQTMAVLHAQSRRFWQSYEPTSSFKKGASLHARIAAAIAARDPDEAVAGVEALFAFLQHLTTLVVRRRYLD